MKPEALIASVPKIPAPSPSVARLLELLARADSDNDDMIKVVRQDGVMSAKLLGLCNSAAYGLAAPVTSIEQAVLMLGQLEIHKLVMSVGFGGALSPAMPGYAMQDGELWKHSLLTAYTAVAVTALAQRTAADPAIAYTAGLIHDIGKVVITHALNREAQAQLRQVIDFGGKSLIEAEREVIGCDHAEVGACLLKQWGLPAMLIEAVANHHTPVSAPVPMLSAIVHVADIIALDAGIAPGVASFAMRVDESAVEALGIGRETVETLILSAYDSLARVEDMISTT
ncbi:MAG: HDOD domain-containing protein [Verrucomicrobiota bacterium]